MSRRSAGAARRGGGRAWRRGRSRRRRSRRGRAVHRARHNRAAPRCRSRSHRAVSGYGRAAACPASVGHSRDRAGRAARSARRGYIDRKRVVEGKSVSVRVDLGGVRIIKKKNNKTELQLTQNSESNSQKKKTM